MFSNASSFNGDISSWDVASVKNMDVSTTIVSYLSHHSKYDLQMFIIV